MTFDEARAALPGWFIRLVAGEGEGYEAREPNYQATGIAVHADDLAELVDRARAFVAVVELAAGRPAPKTPGGSRAATLVAREEEKGALRALPKMPPTTSMGPPKQTAHTREHARSIGYSGDSCGNCGSMSMRRSGVCLTCDVCGTTTGCS